MYTPRRSAVWLHPLGGATARSCGISRPTMFCGAIRKGQHTLTTYKRIRYSYIFRFFYSCNVGLSTFVYLLIQFRDGARIGLHRSELQCILRLNPNALVAVSKGIRGSTTLL